MSGGWRWEYDPDHAHVAGGVPTYVVSEVERLTSQLVELAATGVDVSDFGDAPGRADYGAWTRREDGSPSRVRA
ncbi:hypothetical protein [Streptomyces sp. Z26]|uniref:hypothetical protein n=1 Tax=Streptomyces sp. Z26 TaxID=2500177 RepID=UPI002695B90D